MHEPYRREDIARAGAQALADLDQTPMAVVQVNHWGTPGWRIWAAGNIPPATKPEHVQWVYPSGQTPTVDTDNVPF